MNDDDEASTVCDDDDGDDDDMRHVRNGRAWTSEGVRSVATDDDDDDDGARRLARMWIGARVWARERRRGCGCGYGWTDGETTDVDDY